jgi:hypothetical protein
VVEGDAVVVGGGVGGGPGHMLGNVKSGLFARS